MALTLLIGGARSGKSDLAVRMALARGATAVFVATARPSDDDMSARIARHRAGRPRRWRTLEEPIDLERALVQAGDAVVVVDCLTLWVSNLMLDGLDDAAIERRGRAAAVAAARRDADTIVVTNEVGSGIHPPTALGRRFQDELGRVNRIWSEASRRAFLVVAGRALLLGDPALPG